MDVKEHDETYALMMEALDGELAADRKRQLEVHLRACPECLLQWNALLAIESLLRRTPALSPAAGFTQRTLARLPNHRLRVWALSGVYLLPLLGGALPLLLAVVVVSQLSPLVNQPGLVQSVLAALGSVAQVTGAVVGALVSSGGQFIGQQPIIVGWLLVLAGIVSLWTGVYRQLISQPREI